MEAYTGPVVRNYLLDLEEKLAHRGVEAPLHIMQSSGGVLTAESARKRENPYARPFGRLSLKELEQQITDTEIAIAECQESFGAGGSFKDATRGQRLQTEYKSLSEKLQALEAEYFARET